MVVVSNRLGRPVMGQIEEKVVPESAAAPGRATSPRRPKSASTTGGITAIARLPNAMQVFWIGSEGGLMDTPIALTEIVWSDLLQIILVGLRPGDST